jgi:uncharacterized membrane protein
VKSGQPTTSARRVIVPLVLLGCGVGAFIDGIVLHQILQWHHMLSATSTHPPQTVAGLEANTLADGVFHAAALVLTVLGLAGVIHAWQEGRIAPPWRRHIGLLLIGWAVFNLVEGVIDHHVLGLHNVRDDVSRPGVWNIAFLIASAALLLAGLLLSRTATDSRPERGRLEERDAAGRSGDSYPRFGSYAGPQGTSGARSRATRPPIRGVE